MPGAHTPTALPPAQAQATAGPYTVSMNGTPTVGVTAPMHFQVSGGRPPRCSLEPYLGAYGHLVVVREGDLGTCTSTPSRSWSTGRSSSG